MTVRDLLNANSGNYPDSIVFYDPNENVQDEVQVKGNTVHGTPVYDTDKYYDFIEQYGDYEVSDWHFTHGNENELYIEMDKSIEDEESEDAEDGK